MNLLKAVSFFFPPDPPEDLAKSKFDKKQSQRLHQALCGNGALFLAGFASDDSAADFLTDDIARGIVYAFMVWICEGVWIAQHVVRCDEITRLGGRKRVTSVSQRNINRACGENLRRMLQNRI